MTNVAKIRAKSAANDAVVRTMVVTVPSLTNLDQANPRSFYDHKVLLRTVPNGHDADSREELRAGPEHVFPYPAD